MAEHSIPTEADIVSRSRAITKPGLYSILPRTSRVESVLPNLKGVKAHVLASPQLGACFVEHELLVQPGGGTSRPVDEELEQFLFVLEGKIEIDLADKKHHLGKGGYAWLPPNTAYSLCGAHEAISRMLWVRKRYEVAEGLTIPTAIVANERDVPALAHKGYSPEKNLTPFHEDMAFDMGMILLFFEPGNYFSIAESHVNEHGLYMFEGSMVYWLAGDFHEVQADDFIYMAPYCPQYAIATGWSRSSYVLYNEVNRDYTAGL